VRPNGEWTVYFEEVLRDHGAPTLGAAAAPPVTFAQDVQIDATIWGNAMTAPHDTAEPWGTATPLEADLYEFTPALAEGEPNSVSCRMPPERLKVDVVVHRRSLAELDGSNVSVTLLQWIDPKTKNKAKHDDASTWFSGNVPWTAAVNQLLNTGSTSLSFGQGWAFVGSGANRRKTLNLQTISPLRSGVVTFDIDLRGAKSNLVVLLVAVIREGSDIALAPASLQDLALTSPSVAVRSMRINRT